MPAGAWTDEEQRNAMTYGLCPVCAEPRFTRFTVRRGGVLLSEEEMAPLFDGGPDALAAALGPGPRLDISYGLTCPSGHDPF